MFKIFRQIDILSSPQKYYTRKITRKKTILRKFVLSMLRMSQNEKTNSVLTPS